MSKDFEPMLAERKLPDLEKLPYPFVMTPKLDGIRCVIIDGKPLSRTLKPFKNKFINNYLSNLPGLDGLDGELIVGDPTSATCYSDTDSGVTSIEGEPDFRFYVFEDIHAPAENYNERMRRLRHRFEDYLHKFDRIVFHEAKLASCPQDILDYENEQLEAGYEGLILRHPHKPYKFGRSTMREQGMLKLKRFVDAEFEIVGATEMQHNGNEAQTNELGRTKRSKAQAGMVGMNTLGALICKCGPHFPDPELTFEVGTGPGLTRKRRDELWKMYQDGELVGKRMAKVKWFPIGVKLRPRKPGLLGLRDPEEVQ